MSVPIILDSCERILGFGRRVTWTSDLDVPPGHQMTFKDALHILSTNLFLKIVLPDWAMNLTKHSRKVRQAFIELKVCLSALSYMYTCHRSSSSNTCWKWWKLVRLQLK
jgi:hypothetical protein